MVVEPVLPLAANVARGILRDAVAAKWETRWESSTGYRQTKILFQVPSRIKANKLIRYGKREVGQAVRYITGFAFLRNHQAKMDYGSKLCRLCEKETETSWHIMADCEALHRLRLKHFQDNFLSDPMTWEPSELIGFLREPQVRELEETLDQ